MKKLFASLLALGLFVVPAVQAQPVISFKATISWADNSTNEDGFRVERASALAGPYTQIASVGANVLSYVDQPVAAGATVCYRVSAFNVAGQSAPSAAACATAPSVPAAPGSVQVIITLAP